MIGVGEGGIVVGSTEETEFLDTDEQANLIAELRRKGTIQSLSTRVCVHA